MNVVISNSRGGRPALRAAFGAEAAADEFLSDLACYGGGYLCIEP